ncbi:MAG: valine--tRNA ligase, partial [Lysobacter sp.]|nr:valine--tRNA ligase [Lysobacter sp.]
SELNVKPSDLVTLLLTKGDTRDRARCERFASELKFLNKLDRIEFVDDAASAPPAAPAVVGELTLLVPLPADKLDAERVRLDKEIKRVDGEIGKSRGKLSSETFVQNAPAAVVEQERKRLVDWNVQLEGLTAQRAKLD